MKKILVFLAMLLVFISSCKKDNQQEDKPSAFTPQMGRDTLYYLMQDIYYWYKQMPQVNKDDYNDPYKLLEAMRYKPADRFSFVADYDEYHAEMNGTFVGHGIRIGVDANKKARIAMIYDKSPLYAAGVRRGWIINSVNGSDIGALLASGNREQYNVVLGASKEGVTNQFVFTKPDGSTLSLSSTKTTFQTNTVLLADTLHLNTGVTGHLVYESFIQPSTTELSKAFSYFKENNVKDLILDLRYNPGGLVNIAQTLASYIGGNRLSGTNMAKLEHNDKLTQYNRSFPFVTTSYSLDLPRVVVITTRGTASASEFIINGLRPHVTVVTVGDTTYGKPVGFYEWDAGEKYVFAPTAFKIVNSLGQGEYYFGIAPNKLAPDDITHDFNDRKESSLKEAIYYLEHGNVSTKGFVQPFRNGIQISERPDWMKNLLIEENKPF
ncbi:MAG TPA: S41 family peptidase [Bacteroidales bacterium]|nr:S41 family peptidase [Bacteroidales bacterium]